MPCTWLALAKTGPLKRRRVLKPGDIAHLISSCWQNDRWPANLNGAQARPQPRHIDVVPQVCNRRLRALLRGLKRLVDLLQEK